MKKPKITEAVTLKAIKNVLALKGWQSYRIHQSLGSTKGLPDLFALKDGITVFIEVKAPKGKLTEYQRREGEQMSGKGGLYIVARSAEFVSKTLDDLAIYIPAVEGKPASTIKPVKGMRIICQAP